MNQKKYDFQLTTPNLLTPRILLPESIYVAVGRELNIWKDAVALFPENYTGLQINFFSDVGMNKERCFRFKPEIPGEYPLRVTVDDLNGNNLQTKNTTLVAVPNNGGAGVKNLLFLGDSLFGGAQVATEVRSLIMKDGGFSPVLIGTLGVAPNRHEGRGGWRFDDYSTQGRKFFRFEVVNVKAPLDGNFAFLHNGFEFWIHEINITGSEGYISCVSSSPEATAKCSGTLRQPTIHGDREIAFCKCEVTTFNPFLNETKQDHDFRAYMANNHFSGGLDYVFIELGSNDVSWGADAASVEKIIAYAKNLISGILSHEHGFPTAKIILALPPIGASQDGFGTNYGTAINVDQTKQRIRLLSEALVTAFDEGAFSANVRLAATILWVDRYYGYPRAVVRASDREATLIEEHTNAGHPSVSGYQQMADAFYSAMRSFPVQE